LELERILACDESEMNMEVLAKQRAKNILAEQEDLALKEKASDVRTAWLDHVVEAPEVSESWDPEDNVRYVVKWKGLPTSEMTWEYWRDIKRDGVDLAEDFWYRQQPPTVQEVKDAVLKKHPSLGAFSKLKESPVYGISARSRPVASLEGESPSSPEDEESPFEGFRLRSYQLEGVNWLLFNWWNKRSCILADEMGLGMYTQTEYAFVYVCGWEVEFHGIMDLRAGRRTYTDCLFLTLQVKLFSQPRLCTSYKPIHILKFEDHF